MYIKIQQHIPILFKAIHTHHCDERGYRDDQLQRFAKSQLNILKQIENMVT